MQGGRITQMLWHGLLAFYELISSIKPGPYKKPFEPASSQILHCDSPVIRHSGFRFLFLTYVCVLGF